MLLNLYPEFLILIMFLFPEIVFGSLRNLIVFIFSLLLFSRFNNIIHPSCSVSVCCIERPSLVGLVEGTPESRDQPEAFNYEGKPGLIPLLPPRTQVPFSFFLPHSQLLFFFFRLIHPMVWKRNQGQSLSPHTPCLSRRQPGLLGSAETSRYILCVVKQIHI